MWIIYSCDVCCEHLILFQQTVFININTAVEKSKYHFGAGMGGWNTEKCAYMEFSSCTYMKSFRTQKNVSSLATTTTKNRKKTCNCICYPTCISVWEKSLNKFLFHLLSRNVLKKYQNNNVFSSLHKLFSVFRSFRMQ